MFDDRATPVQKIGPFRYPHFHTLKSIFVFKAGDGAVSVCALRSQWTIAAGAGIGIVNLLHLAQPALADGFEFMPARANIDVLRSVVAKLILAEKAIRHGCPALRARHVGHEPRLLAGRDVLGSKITGNRTPEHARAASRLLLTKAARRMRRDGWNAGRLALWLDLMRDGSWSRSRGLPAVHDDQAVLSALECLWGEERFSGIS
jgi:impB/mucB/samB family C-terminal domain